MFSDKLSCNRSNQGKINGKLFFQVPVLLFLQNALLSQDNFPQHYADCLNGCGLELENRVRKAFYSFIQKLVNIVVAHLVNYS